MGDVPYVDVAGTIDAREGKVSVFVLNRDLSQTHEIELMWEDKSPSAAVSSWLLTGDDLKASNSFAASQRVSPQPFAKPSFAGSRTRVEVPARSYVVMELAL